MTTEAQETYSSEAPVCPYCGHMPEHDGGFYYDESRDELECEKCDRVSDMSIYTSTTWTCTPRAEGRS